MTYGTYKTPKFNNGPTRGISVLMQKELWERFDQIARRQNRAKACIVLEMVEQFVAANTLEKAS